MAKVSIICSWCNGEHKPDLNGNVWCGFNKSAYSTHLTCSIRVDVSDGSVRVNTQYGGGVPDVDTHLNGIHMLSKARVMPDHDRHQVVAGSVVLFKGDEESCRKFYALCHLALREGCVVLMMTTSLGLCPYCGERMKVDSIFCHYYWCQCSPVAFVPQNGTLFTYLGDHKWQLERVSGFHISGLSSFFNYTSQEDAEVKEGAAFTVGGRSYAFIIDGIAILRSQKDDCLNARYIFSTHIAPALELHDYRGKPCSRETYRRNAGIVRIIEPSVKDGLIMHICEAIEDTGCIEEAIIENAGISESVWELTKDHPLIKRAMEAEKQAQRDALARRAALCVAYSGGAEDVIKMRAGIDEVEWSGIKSHPRIKDALEEEQARLSGNAIRWEGTPMWGDFMSTLMYDGLSFPVRYPFPHSSFGNLDFPRMQLPPRHRYAHTSKRINELMKGLFEQVSKETPMPSCTSQFRFPRVLGFTAGKTSDYCHVCGRTIKHATTRDGMYHCHKCLENGTVAAWTGGKVRISATFTTGLAKVIIMVHSHRLEFDLFEISHFSWRKSEGDAPNCTATAPPHAQGILHMHNGEQHSLIIVVGKHARLDNLQSLMEFVLLSAHDQVGNQDRSLYRIDQPCSILTCDSAWTMQDPVYGDTKCPKCGTYLDSLTVEKFDSLLRSVFSDEELPFELNSVSDAHSMYVQFEKATVWCNIYNVNLTLLDKGNKAIFLKLVMPIGKKRDKPVFKWTYKRIRDFVVPALKAW